MKGQASRAISDLNEGAGRFRLWAELAWRDVRNHYRRSYLGPFWLTLSLGILVAGLGSLYSELMNRPLDTYIPHITTGFIAWQFISGVFNEAGTVFAKPAVLMLNVRLPLSLHVYTLVFRQVIGMVHSFAVYLVVAVLFSVPVDESILFLVPAIGLFIVNGLWVTLLLGTVSTRFRDVPQMVTTLIRIAFFLTPIIWVSDQLGERAAWAEYNPFAHFVMIFRAPLLGEVPSLSAYAVVIAITLAGSAAAFLVFASARRRIPLWL